MSTSPLITTIIPTYNRANLLKFAIASVQSQTFSNIQILVLDNASSDNTSSVISSLSKQDPRIKYHRHSTNIGSGANFKYGYHQVDTPFFSFLSDDDVLLPEFYERAHQLLVKYPQAGFSAGQMIFMKSNGYISSVHSVNWKMEEYYQTGEGAKRLSKEEWPGWTARLFKKSSCERLGGIGDDTRMDAEFGLNTMMRQSFVTFKYPCAIFVCADLKPEFEEKIRLYSKNTTELIDKFQNQANLSELNKKFATQTLVSEYKRVLFRWFVKALIFKNWKLAIDLRNKIVINQGKSFATNFYGCAIVACKYISVFHYFGLCAYRFARLVKDVANNYRYRKYGNYVNYCAQLYKSKIGGNWFKVLQNEKVENL